MRNTFKILQKTLAILVIAFSGLTFIGTKPAHALVDNYLFGYTYQGVGDEALVINGGAGNGGYTIQATSGGWYENNGNTNFPINTNYIVGTCVSCGGYTIRDFFSFSLSGVTGPITSASLAIYNPSNGYTGAPTSTYTVYGANQIASALLSGTSSVATYNSMTSGHVFGTQSVSTANNGSDVNITLDSGAIASLVHHEGGTYTVAGALTVSNVPLPAGLPMFAAAVLAVFGVVQFRKKRQFA